MANWSFQESKFHTHPLHTDITYIDFFPGSWIHKNTRLVYPHVGVCTFLSATVWFGRRLRNVSRITRGNHVAWLTPFGYPAAGKKNEESNSPLTPVSRSFARSHAGVCLHEANRGAESHQPDVRRINAIIARSASRFIDRWLHHFAAFNRPFDCFSVSLLILAFWFFVPILRILPFFLFVVVLPFLLAILYLCIVS